MDIVDIIGWAPGPDKVKEEIKQKFAIVPTTCQYWGKSERIWLESYWVYTRFVNGEISQQLVMTEDQYLIFKLSQ